MTGPIDKQSAHLLPGDVIFVKQARNRNAARTGIHVQFHGVGFALLLGEVKPGAPEPTIEHVIRLLSALGFVSYDEVIEHLGQEQGDLLIKKVEEKYDALALDDSRSAEAPQASDRDQPTLFERPKLVSLSGRPLETPDS